VKAEAWMSIIHGSRGIIWFVHQFKPKFNEHALLDDPQMLAAVTALNHQIHDLAPAINSEITADVTVKSNVEQAPIDLMARKQGNATYVFAVGMRNAGAKGTFTVAGSKDGGSVEVIGESRRLTIHERTFEDGFAPYAVHLYKIPE
jgi:hypothetical protein